MRRVIVSNLVSLDGFFTGPNEEIDWHVLIVQALAGQRGQIDRGKVAIGETYAGFVSLKPILRREEIVEADGVAFHCSRWTLTVTSPDGKKPERAGVSSDVLRRQSNRRWLVLIYNPYGTNIVG